MQNHPNKIQVSAKAPSNIAFIKYWGKYGVQLPLNPSLSMTLSDSYTKTSWTLDRDEDYALEVYLDDELQPSFNAKIEQWFNKLPEEFNFLKQSKSIIKTHNTFPHSTGIASSASAFAALSTCLSQLYSNIYTNELEKKEISRLARLGSGSACRSIEGPFCEWGEASNEYATKLDEVHENFKSLKDAICIVSSKEKTISSSIGHAMMNDHPFKDARIKQANDNYTELKEALRNGLFSKFGEILEQEALSLHALMMSSKDSYTLFEPNSIELIHQIRKFRNETNLPVYFTFDAGPNMHLIYPESIEKDVQNYLEKLKGDGFINLILYDHLGDGALICN